MEEWITAQEKELAEEMQKAIQQLGEMQALVQRIEGAQALLARLKEHLLEQNQQG